MQDSNENQVDDARSMLTVDELLQLEKGKSSLMSLVRLIAKARHDRNKEYAESFQNERVVVGNVKRMYEELIERKLELLKDLKEQVEMMEFNERQ